MHERKVEMARRSCGFIGLPGGFGTFEEVFEVTTWTQIGIHSKRMHLVLLQRSYTVLTLTTAVVLANVLGFFDPIRALIQNSIKEGFIRPVGSDLIKFVDGPSDHSLHESFDWGKSLLEEIDSWKDDPSYSLGFDWTKPLCGGEQTEALEST
jgi:predicted Rossmann-fold nucleotide-binding protein